METLGDGLGAVLVFLGSVVITHKCAEPRPGVPDRQSSAEMNCVWQSR